MSEKPTGYPSIDKPWLKYYSEEATDKPLPECKYVDYLIEKNKDNIDSVAIEVIGASYSYRRLFDCAQKTAIGLQTVGVEPGDVVPIFSVNTFETICLIFALNLIGAVPCLEYITISEKEAIESIRKCKAKTVAMLDVLLEKYSSDFEQVENVVVLPLIKKMPLHKRLMHYVVHGRTKTSKTITFTDLENNHNVNFIDYSYQKNAPAIIVHSGGTTGVPKGVELSNENLNYIAWAFSNNGSGTTKGDKWYTSIPLFHAFGLCMGIIVPLSLSQRVYLDVKYDEGAFVKNFKRIKPNHTMGSSTYLPALMADKEIQKMDLSFYKTMGMGGTPMTHAQEDAVCKFMEERGSFAKASIGYGMSETASAACTELNRYYGKIGSVGIPLPGVNIKVVHRDSMEELSYGKEGELLISTPGLMLRYYKNEEETKSVLLTDKDGVRWIKTGDIGYIDEDGFVFVTGKLKRIYTTRADEKSPIMHIFPDYITQVIDSAPCVHECAVVCLSHPVLKSIPIAFVALDHKNSEEAISKVKACCEERLPEHSWPKAIYSMERIPKTSVGKPDYKKLEEIAEGLYSK